MGKIRRIALLADQPWQAELAVKIAHSLNDTTEKLEISLVFTDYYTFLLRKDFLLGLELGFPGMIFTQIDLFTEWQIDDNENKYDVDFLSQWEAQNCSNRDLMTISKTNQWLYGNERDKYQKKLSTNWRTKILFDTIKWCEEVFKAIQPDLIVSIERCTLPTSILYEISKREKSKFISIIPSRIGTRWLVREDLAYGTPVLLRDQILREHSSLDGLTLAETFVANMRIERVGGYFSLSHQISRTLSNKKTQLFTSFFTDLRKMLGRIYGRVFIQPKERAVKAKRVRENLIALSRVDFKQFVTVYLHLMGVRFWGTTRLPKQPYFLWALHMRPEGSGLVLGDARDELEELLKSADLLPRDCFLAVKENPEMFGLRQFGFYSRLKSHKQIILVDPFSPSFPLIENSIGVIGISGTILLESALLNKPSCALGHPEFEGFLVKSGWSSAAEFFQDCLSGRGVGAKDKMLPYLSYVLQTSRDFGIGFEGDLKVQETEQLVESLSKNIQTFLR